MALAKEESIKLVKRLIALQLRDATHRHLFTMHGVRGQITHDRLMRIARHSLLDTAFDTEAHRDILEHEAQIPTQVFFDRVNITGWIGLKPDLFYETGLDWKASIVSTMPSASDITNEQVHELLGYSGGGGEGSDNPFPETSVAERRLQRVCEWALTEYPIASLHTYGEQGGRNDNRYLQRSAAIFRGFIYSTLWLALNPTNLTDAKWSLIAPGLRTWREFAKYFAVDATGNDPNAHAGTVYLVDNTFYDGTNVWIWNPVQPRSLLRARTVSGVIDSPINDLPTDARPEFGLGKDHITVREMLGLRQPFNIHQAELSALTAQDQDDNDILITPAFDSDVFEYTAEVDRTVTSVAISPTAFNNYASIEVDGDISISTLPETFSIHIVSQDGEVEKTYTLTISRTT